MKAEAQKLEQKIFFSFQSSNQFMNLRKYFDGYYRPDARVILITKNELILRYQSENQVPFNLPDRKFFYLAALVSELKSIFTYAIYKTSSLHFYARAD